VRTFARLPSILLAVSLAVSFAAFNPPPAHGQFVRELVNNQGATAPCTGIELGIGLIKKCVDTFADAGFIRVNELGVTGLTFGTSLPTDGRVTAIAAGSAAEQAGLHVGDLVTAVEGKPVRPHPGAVAQKELFGPNGAVVHVRLRRDGMSGGPIEVTLKRAQLAPPPKPKSPSFLFIMHPLADWRNVVIPCMGGGVAAPAAFVYCDNHFKPYGYLKFGDLGTTGIQMDMERENAAIVKAVDAGSPAAAAGVQPGDEVVSVDGKAPAPDLSEQASERLFGHIGDAFHVTVRSGGAEKTVVLTLTAKPKES